MAGIVEALQANELVGLDTSLFIYQIEDAPRYAAAAHLVFKELEQGRFEASTSVLTVMELQVKPLQLGRPELADEYEALLARYPHLRILGIDRTAARTAAELRAAYRLGPADSLQVAACLRAGATAFLTNDRDLRRVRELQVLLLDDFVGP